jgi:hypothetical protein
MNTRKPLLLALALSFSILVTAQSYNIQPVAIQSRWAKDVSPTNSLKEYPPTNGAG